MNIRRLHQRLLKLKKLKKEIYTQDFPQRKDGYQQSKKILSPIYFQHQSQNLDSLIYGGIILALFIRIIKEMNIQALNLKHLLTGIMAKNLIQEVGYLNKRGKRLTENFLKNKLKPQMILIWYGAKILLIIELKKVILLLQNS